MRRWVMSEKHTPTTAAEVLRAARALIAEPERWCKGNFATLPDGTGVGPRDPQAIAFCIRGVITRTCAVGVSRDARKEAESLLRDCLPAEFYGRLSAFNDAGATSHADVLALIDTALAATPPTPGPEGDVEVSRGG
jgi:hypothetical protein